MYEINGKRPRMEPCGLAEKAKDMKRGKGIRKLTEKVRIVGRNQRTRKTGMPCWDRIWKREG